MLYKKNIQTIEIPLFKNQDLFSFQIFLMIQNSIVNTEDKEKSCYQIHISSDSAVWSTEVVAWYVRSTVQGSHRSIHLGPSSSCTANFKNNTKRYGIPVRVVATAYTVNGDAGDLSSSGCPLFTVHSGVAPIQIERMGNRFRYADNAQQHIAFLLLLFISYDH
jgi:hypothetical protein